MVERVRMVVGMVLLVQVVGMVRLVQVVGMVHQMAMDRRVVLGGMSWVGSRRVRYRQDMLVV